MQDRLNQRRSESLLRTARKTVRLSPTTISVNGQPLINFGANDYLGLSWHSVSEEYDSKDLIGRDLSRLERNTGSGAAPLITGYSERHQELEETIARFENSEAAIVFSTGYAANVGTVSALAGGGDMILSDSLNHASLIDGCRLSKAETFVYAHNNMEAVKSILQENRANFRRCFIVTDTLFSMTGDLVDLGALAKLAADFDSSVIVDEAHATGIYGENGRGWVEESGLENQIQIRIGTFSKAIGCMGGFVHGSQILIDYLRNFARTYVYSTSMPPGLAADVCQNIERISSMNSERLHLRSASSKLRRELVDCGLNVPLGDSPIIPIYLKSSQEVLAASYSLREHGFYVPGIRPPTVPDDQTMLRVSLSICHTEEQIDALKQAIKIALRF